MLGPEAPSSVWSVELMSVVLTVFDHRIINAVFEGLNTRIQTIKDMAYGRCAKN